MTSFIPEPFTQAVPAMLQHHCIPEDHDNFGLLNSGVGQIPCVALKTGCEATEPGRCWLNKLTVLSQMIVLYTLSFAFEYRGIAARQDVMRTCLKKEDDGVSNEMALHAFKTLGATSAQYGVLGYVTIQIAVRPYEDMTNELKWQEASRAKIAY